MKTTIDMSLLSLLENYATGKALTFAAPDGKGLVSVTPEIQAFALAMLKKVGWRGDAK